MHFKLEAMLEELLDAIDILYVPAEIYITLVGSSLKSFILSTVLLPNNSTFGETKKSLIFLVKFFLATYVSN